MSARCAARGSTRLKTSAVSNEVCTRQLRSMPWIPHSALFPKTGERERSDRSQGHSASSRGGETCWESAKLVEHVTAPLSLSTNTMNVLQLVTRNEMRGAEVFAGQVSEALSMRGHEVVQAGLYELESASRRLSFRHAREYELHGRVKGRFEWPTMRRLAGLVREFKPAIVQANGFHALKYAALLKQFSRPPWPIVYRNISIASKWIRWPYQRYWGRWICRTVSYVLSVSDCSAHDFHRTYRVPRQRVLVVRRGIAVPQAVDVGAIRHAVCEMTGVNGASQFVCHVGGFSSEKNHVGLIDAFERIHARRPTTHLVLVGDGPLRRDVEESVYSRDLADCVHFLGYRDDARDLIGGMDLLLLSSHIEGIPGVVLEAAARRVPSVCTNVGAVSEVIDAGRNGILVPPGDMASLANAALELLRDDTRRSVLGQAAFDHVREHHCMEAAVDRFEEVYKQAISEFGNANS